MNLLFKRFPPLAAFLPLLAITLSAPSAVKAALSATNTTFQGDVPSACNFTSGSGQNVTINPEGTTLNGTSSPIGITANGSVNVALSNLTVATKPVGTTVTPTARLSVSAGPVLGTATVGNDMTAAALNNNTNAEKRVEIRMTVTGATLVGSYSTTVVLSCLAL